MGIILVDRSMGKRKTEILRGKVISGCKGASFLALCEAMEYGSRKIFIADWKKRKIM